jgi:acid stress-induced BolA-like protein IbaG/YrbA
MALKDPKVARLLETADDPVLGIEDRFALVETLARAHENALGLRRGEGEHFAATVLCYLFDPVKTQRLEYATAMMAIRSEFRGLAADAGTRALFRGSMTPVLLKALTPAQAINTEVSELFALVPRQDLMQ